MLPLPVIIFRLLKLTRNGYKSKINKLTERQLSISYQLHEPRWTLMNYGKMKMCDIFKLKLIQFNIPLTIYSPFYLFCKKYFHYNATRRNNGRNVSYRYQVKVSHVKSNGMTQEVRMVHATVRNSKILAYIETNKRQLYHPIKLDPFYSDSFFGISSFNQESTLNDLSSDNFETDIQKENKNSLISLKSVKQIKISPREIANNFKYPTFTSFPNVTEKVTDEITNNLENKGNIWDETGLGIYKVKLNNNYKNDNVINIEKHNDDRFNLEKNNQQLNNDLSSLNETLYDKKVEIIEIDGNSNNFNTSSKENNEYDVLTSKENYEISNKDINTSEVRIEQDGSDRETFQKLCRIKNKNPKRLPLTELVREGGDYYEKIETFDPSSTDAYYIRRPSLERSNKVQNNVEKIEQEFSKFLETNYTIIDKVKEKEKNVKESKNIEIIPENEYKLLEKECKIISQINSMNEIPQKSENDKNNESLSEMLPKTSKYIEQNNINSKQTSTEQEQDTENQLMLNKEEINSLDANHSKNFSPNFNKVLGANDYILLKENVNSAFLNEFDTNYSLVNFNNLNSAEQLLVSTKLGTRKEKKNIHEGKEEFYGGLNNEKSFKKHNLVSWKNIQTNKIVKFLKYFGNDIYEGNKPFEIKVEKCTRRNLLNKYWIPKKQIIGEHVLNILEVGTQSIEPKSEIVYFFKTDSENSEKYSTDSPIIKEKVVDETVVPKRSILSIINSVDRAGIIIQKDLYITDRIMQKIKNEKTEETLDEKKNSKITPQSAKSSLELQNNQDTFIFSQPDVNVAKVDSSNLNFGSRGRLDLEIIRRTKAVIEKEKYLEEITNRKIQETGKQEDKNPAKEVSPIDPNKLSTYGSEDPEVKIDTLKENENIKMQKDFDESNDAGIPYGMYNDINLQTAEIQNHLDNETFETTENLKEDNVMSNDISENETVKPFRIKNNICSRGNSALFEYRPLVDRSVRCMVKNKNEKYISNRKLHTPDMSKKSEKSGISTKTTIVTETEGDSVKIKIDEIQKFIDPRIPVPFSTQTSFQIVGSAIRLKDHIDVVDRTKAQIETTFHKNKPSIVPGKSTVMPLIDNLLEALKVETSKNKAFKIKTSLQQKIDMAVKSTSPINIVPHSPQLKKVTPKSPLKKFSKQNQMKNLAKTSHPDMKRKPATRSSMTKKLNKHYYDTTEEIKVVKPNEFESITGLKNERKRHTKVSDRAKTKLEREKKILELKPVINNVQTDKNRYVNLFNINTKIEEKKPEDIGRRKRRRLDEHNLSQRDQKILKEILKQKRRRLTLNKNSIRSYIKGDRPTPEPPSTTPNKLQTSATSKIIEVKDNQSEKNSIFLKVETVVPKAVVRSSIITVSDKMEKKIEKQLSNPLNEKKKNVSSVAVTKPDLQFPVSTKREVITNIDMESNIKKDNLLPAKPDPQVPVKVESEEYTNKDIESTIIKENLVQLKPDIEFPYKIESEENKNKNVELNLKKENLVQHKPDLQFPNKIESKEVVEPNLKKENLVQVKPDLKAPVKIETEEKSTKEIQSNIKKENLIQPEPVEIKTKNLPNKPLNFAGIVKKIISKPIVAQKPPEEEKIKTTSEELKVDSSKNSNNVEKNRSKSPKITIIERYNKDDNTSFNKENIIGKVIQSIQIKNIPKYNLTPSVKQTSEKPAPKQKDKPKHLELLIEPPKEKVTEKKNKENMKNDYEWKGELLERADKARKVKELLLERKQEKLYERDKMLPKSSMEPFALDKKETLPNNVDMSQKSETLTSKSVQEQKEAPLKNFDVEKSENLPFKNLQEQKQTPLKNIDVEKPETLTSKSVQEQKEALLRNFDVQKSENLPFKNLQEQKQTPLKNIDVEKPETLTSKSVQEQKEALLRNVDVEKPETLPFKNLQEQKEVELLNRNTSLDGLKTKTKDELKIKTVNMKSDTNVTEVKKLDIQKTLLTDPPGTPKPTLSFPMLQVDLDKLSKEIKPDLDLANIKPIQMEYHKILSHPLFNSNKSFEIVPSKSVVQVSTSKDPSIRKVLGTLPSVTKILNSTLSDTSRKALKTWRNTMINQIGGAEFQNFYKAELCKGSEFHRELQTQLLKRNKKVVKSNCPYLQSISKVFADITDVLVVDSHVLHRNLAYRGVVDCVVMYRNKPVLVEWKRAERPDEVDKSNADACVQLAAYIGAINFDENFKFQVTGGLIVMAYNDGSEAKVFELSKDDCILHWKVWLTRLQKYRQLITNR